MSCRLYSLSRDRDLVFGRFKQRLGTFYDRPFRYSGGLRLRGVRRLVVLVNSRGGATCSEIDFCGRLEAASEDA